MSQISKIIGRQIIDSRDNPTVEADVFLLDGSMGRASVPSGASTGSHEDVELRDNDPKKFEGMGVEKAVGNVNGEISKLLLGKEWNQKSLDQAMIACDGTENKSRLGANAILAVSMAFSKATALSEKKPLYRYFQDISQTENIFLPVPMMNVMNGGKHAEHSTDFQEYMIVPLGAPTFREALRYGTEVFDELRKILEARGLDTNVGDEGGFAPQLPTNESPLELILEAIGNAGYIAGKDICLALDPASSEFYVDGIYNLKSENRKLGSDEMISFYKDLVSKYPIISIEDGLAEDDWDAWKKMTLEFSLNRFEGTIGQSKIQLVGDDLFVTNVLRLKKGIEEKVANSILIKLNQVGTVTETISAVQTARNAGYTSIISHRSGETEDTTIAHFAVGLGTGQIKTGSLTRGERTAKYNELLRIEEELGDKAVYLGKKAFKM